MRKQHHIALMSVSKVCHIIAEIYAEYVRQNLNAAQKHGSVTIAPDATALKDDTAAHRNPGASRAASGSSSTRSASTRSCFSGSTRCV